MPEFQSNSEATQNTQPPCHSPGSVALSLRWRGQGRWLCREGAGGDAITDVLSMVNRKPQLMQSLREDYTPTSEINLEGQGRV